MHRTLAAMTLGTILALAAPTAFAEGNTDAGQPKPAASPATVLPAASGEGIVAGPGPSGQDLGPYRDAHLDNQGQ
ncbi:MAG TPA: hypothetical protein VKV57_16200 [bacterium]|nr:hypothetical protein [bacterium]